MDLAQHHNPINWHYVEKVGEYHFWHAYDGNGDKFYNVSKRKDSMPEAAGGWYNLEALKKAKGIS